MRQIINKVIAVEGLDKTGKSTFVDAFATEYANMYNVTDDPLFVRRFPDANTPIGNSIRMELESLAPNPDIVNTPNFLSEMCHFWMQELYNLHYVNLTDETATNFINRRQKVSTRNYIFDRYFISTLAYQAFYANSQADLDFIKTVLNTNKFVKIPTDIILLDLPNSVIIERVAADQEEGNTDANDTSDEDILDKRRNAYVSAIRFLKGMNIEIHWFEDVSQFPTDDLVKVLMGKIFR